MKGIFVFSVLLIFLFGTPVSADYQKGWDAYDGGDMIIVAATNESELPYDPSAFRDFSLDDPITMPDNLDSEFPDFLSLNSYLMGLLAYQSGDYATALQEWRLLAEQGFAKAQHNLSLMYHMGVGVTQDYKTALKWYTLAAEQGHASSQFNLGKMYHDGDGVVQVYKTAFKWYTLAAEQGHAKAQNDLGALYYSGQGAAQDYTRAHMWWNIAGSQGYEDAGRRRDIIEYEMTPSQLEKAQDLAQECVAKNYKGC